MLVETDYVANIEIINTENYLNKDGYYEIDFYPDKKFKGEKYVFFHLIESWGNVHWYKMFRQYESEGFKVIAYTSFNFLPLLRNLCHKAYLEKTSLVRGFYNGRKTPRMSSHGMDVNRFCKLNGVPEVSRRYTPTYFTTWMMADQEALRLGQGHCKSPIMIDEKEFDNLIKKKHELGESQIVIESKPTYNKSLRNSLQKIDNVHADYSFQRKMLTEYTKFSYATYQILLSMYCGYSFIGIRGAASLLSAMPLNFLIGSDEYNSNFTTFSIRYHDALNDYFYRYPTSGFPHHLDAGRQIENTWREKAINSVIEDWLAMDVHSLPTKKISHFSPRNNKLDFLLDK